MFAGSQAAVQILMGDKMKKHNCISLAALFAAVIMISLLDGCSHVAVSYEPGRDTNVLREEPFFQGKSLTAWLEQDVTNFSLWSYFSLNQPPEYDTEEAKRARQELHNRQSPGFRTEEAERLRARTEAEFAIRCIGTNALPYLIKMAGAKDSKTAETYQTMAYWGFACLRSTAAPAIPSLIELVRSQTNHLEVNTANTAANCLIMIGSAAVPELLALFTNEDREVSRVAADAVTAMVPQLAYLLKTDENETNRLRLVIELAEIRKNKSICLSAEASKNNGGGIYWGISEALTNALNDKSLFVRSAATNALKTIDAEAAAKAEIK
jgi:hypothetical protein